MADQVSIIVGAGTTAGGSFVVGRVAYVTQASPAVISTSFPAIVADGAVVGILSIPTSAGVFNAIAGATEMLRVQGGAIISGSGLDTVQIGRTAVAGAPGSVAIGRGASDGNGQQGVYIGELAVATNAAGIAIGETAAIHGNAGGSLGIAIGAGASATSTSAGNGFSLAIGGSAVAKDGDTVVGYSASSNVAGNGNGNSVFGALATINVSLGAGVAIGSSSSIGAKAGVAIGQGATIATGINNIAIGQVAKVNGAVTNCVVIGQNSVASSNSAIMIGGGAVDLGANTCQIGTPNTNITTFVLGQGGTVATPAARTISFTNGTGVDNVAGFLTIQAPLSTGAGTPAGVTISGGQVLGSSGTLQTAAAIVTFRQNATTTAIAEMVFGQATARIVGGATNGVAIRNSGNTRDNLTIADNGGQVLLSNGTNSGSIFALAVNGEQPAGFVFRAGSGQGGSFCTGLTTGDRAVVAYYNNTDATFRSAAEVSCVTGAGLFGTLSLMKSGGVVAIGTTQLTIAAATGIISAYNNVATAGLGVPANYASGRVTAKTNVASGTIATYTPAADGTFEVGANVLVTATTACSFTVTVTYTDEGNTAQTLILSFTQVAGVALQTITNVTGTGPYEGVSVRIRAKGGTAITIQTAAGGTYTGVTYNASADITQYAA